MTVKIYKNDNKKVPKAVYENVDDIIMDPGKRYISLWMSLRDYDEPILVDVETEYAIIE